MIDKQQFEESLSYSLIKIRQLLLRGFHRFNDNDASGFIKSLIIKFIKQQYDSKFCKVFASNLFVKCKVQSSYIQSIDIININNFYYRTSEANFLYKELKDIFQNFDYKSYFNKYYEKENLNHKNDLEFSPNIITNYSKLESIKF